MKKWIRFNLDGMIFKIEIHGYNDEDNDWLKTSFRFKFEDIIDYKHDDDEILSKDCLDYLIDCIKKHLDNKYKKTKTIGFFEPDFEFVLNPMRYIYGDDIVRDENDKILIDETMELRVYLWHNCLTDNYFSMTFEREDIKRFYDYLLEVIKE